MQAELKALKSRMNHAEEHISDLEERIMEITQSGQWTENQMENKQKQYLWDNIKWANLCIIGIPGGEEKEKGIGNIFREIMVENFTNLKETGSHQDIL